MFRTKKDVDRHAQDIHRKVKNETEKLLRYYNLGKLYYQVGDYESARRYVMGYLSVKQNSASAHKLLGQALEALGQKDKALAEYKNSLTLERRQSDLVLKVCELLSESEISDKGAAQYWCDEAEQLFPHNPVVFRLKEKLLRCEGQINSAEVEALITNELAARPTDVTLHVRLLKLYLEQRRVADAYQKVLDQESKAVFKEELSWYMVAEEVFKAYKESNPSGCNWEFYLNYTSVLERAACLNLCETLGTPQRMLADCVQALFRFDQVLEETSIQNPPGSEQNLFQVFLTHQRGQLCLHLATLLMKRAKKERGNWREVCRAAAPMLLLAMVPPPDPNGQWLLHTNKVRRKAAEWWVKEAAYRNSQAGHVILGILQRDTRTQFKDYVRQFCSGNWRERVYQKVFNTRDHQQAIGTSHFVKHSFFIEPELEIPSILALRPQDELSQKLHPNSLHHLVWLGLQEFTNKRNGNKLAPDFRCLVFETLQLTCSNLNMASVETLNRLDIDAFLYAAVFCARAYQEEQQAAGFGNSERPCTLPANITDMLCTVEQAKWWSAAYRVYTNQSRGELGELRQTLQRGIEVVRVLGNHGLDVRLIVLLAKTFVDRASAMATRTDASAELAAVEARASLYWNCALPLLDRLQRNQAVRAPHTRLFEYQGKDLSMAEVNTLLEEGRFFLACQLMKEEKHEKALEAFGQLKSPDASFYQAQIYKRLAAQEMEAMRGDQITSEMRSQHIILLTKVRDTLYLTLDRLRSPGVDPKHPLNAVISTHIEEIESQLARIDPDISRGDVNRNDLDNLSDGSVSSEHSGGENVNSFFGFMNHSSYLQTTPKHLNGTPRLGSTPHRSGNRSDWGRAGHDSSRRTEARPSPERLEAQIRQIMHGRDSHMQTLVQQCSSILDTNKNMLNSIAKLADGMDEIKNLLKELVKKKETQRRDSHNVSDLPQVDPEEDLYVFDDDYSEDVNAAANQLNQYPAFPPYPSYPGYRHMYGGNTVAYGPPPSTEPVAGPTPLLPPGSAMGGFFRNMDPALMYPQALSYFSQGALPFSEGQQLPDFRTAPNFSRLTAPPAPAADSPVLHKLAQTPAAPVNVVITSSDTLPTTAPLTQPTLSVTIPPQHRLGTPLVHTMPVPAPPILPPTAPPPVMMSLPPIASTVVVTRVSFTTSVTTSTTTSTSSGTSSVPHAFQISMPPQAQLPVASRLEKNAAALSPVLPISTQTLLSSVPSPVYSAVVPERSPTNKETTPKQHRVSTGSAGADDDDIVETEHDPCPDFKPVIPLPAEVEVNTGEEEEAVLFENRCKLYRFVEKEWKERGVGKLKLLHHKETGKVRLLMRREQVLKVCANHIVNPDMELTAMGERAWIWAANDFADEKMQLEKLCARFKTAEEASNFAAAFNNGRELARHAKASPVARRTSERREVSQEESSTSSSTSTSSTLSTPSSEKIVVGGFTFASPPIFNITQTAQDAAKEEKKAGSPKPSPFAACFFTAPTNKASSGEQKAGVTSRSILAKPKLSFGEPGQKTEMNKSKEESNETPTKHNLFASPLFSKTQSDELSKQSVAKPQESSTEVQEIKTKEKLMFNSNIDVTFSTLASAAKESPFKTEPNFKGFAGAGKPVFGSSPQTLKAAPVDTPNTAENEEEGAAEEFVPTAEFKPVIPLPELIEVRTGEEDEEALYNERVKLLRFDSDAKEWKERGVGQMRILRDPKTERIRLLMRREQVLKICCNHALIKSMQFKALLTSDRVWTWCAQDYSEGEVKRETFAIRFKNAELAKAFKEVIDRCQANMKEGITDAAPQQEKENWNCDKCFFSNSANDNKCKSCSNPKDKAVSLELPKLSELFKPAAGSWECSDCYTRNAGSSSKCLSCGALNQTSEPLSSPDVAKKTAPNKPSVQSPRPLSEMFKPLAGSWECKVCYIRNDSHTVTCVACSSAKPGHEAAVAAREASSGSLTFGLQPGATSSGFSFGIPPASGDAAGFSFGIPQSSTTTTTSTATTQSTFPFYETPTTKEFSFGIPLASATEATAVVSSTTGSMDPVIKDPVKPFVFEPKSGPSPFQFGNAASFSFGSTSTTTGQQQSGTQSNFVFGSSGDFKFNFSGVRPKSPVKSPKSPGVVGTSGGEDDSESEHEEDEGDHIYFQPVIPLPDKVPLHTGEEQEDILYCHRAKLYRFLSGEWKERGVGDVKILKNRTTRKIRLLMRREQVLKLCLNHFLTADMIFLEKDEKSWLWHAADFSEGEVQNEQFAIRFVSKEVALAFKEALDKAQAELSGDNHQDSTPSANDPTSMVSSTPRATTEQSEQEKPDNSSSPSATCNSSTTPKLKANSAQKANVVRSLFEDISSDSGGLNISSCTEGGEVEEDDVVEVYRAMVTPEERARSLELKLPENFFLYKQKPPCPGCRGCEPESDSEEQRTGTEKQKKTILSPPQLSVPTSMLSAATSAPVPSIFSGAINTHSFGQPAVFGQTTKGSLFSQPPSEGTAAKPIFGQSALSTFSFAAAANTSSLFKAPSNPASTVATSSIFGQPVVTGASTAATSTIFRSATTVASSLFGEPPSTVATSTNFGPSTGTVTTSIFDQPVSTVATSTTFGQSAATNTTSIFGQPSSSAPSKFGSGTSTTSSSFFNLGTSTTTASLFGSVSSVTTSSIFGSTSTSSTTAPATSLFSGPSFMQTRTQQQSEGSASPFAAPAKLETSSLFVQSPTVETKTTQASIFGSSANIGSTVSATPVFGVGPAVTAATSTTPNTTAPSFFFNKTLSTTTPSESPKPFTFEVSKPALTEPVKPFTFEFNKPASVTSDSTSLEFQSKMGELFSSETKPGESKKEPEATSEEGVPFLPTVEGLSFAAIASKSTESPFASTDSPKTLQWTGAGSAVFGNSPLNRSNRSLTIGGEGAKGTPLGKKETESDPEDEEEGAGGTDDGAYDPHYEPIIALPDAIEVVTGEEEEVKVFGERAKLYRYEAETKEWKERGVGEMKILKHPVGGTYRLLLRREQVHKVVCNHRILADLELKRLATSDRGWCWCAMNHAEEVACVENLAVRFKSPEIAKQFYDKVMEAVQEVAASSVNAGVPAESAYSTVSTVSDEDDFEEVGEEEDEYGEEDEDDDENELDRLMFEKRATMLVREPNGTQWTSLGQGELRVLYDMGYYTTRIILEADSTGAMLCNVPITADMEIQVKKKECTWTAADYVEDPVLREFMARFSSETAAQEFEQVFLEGKAMASHDEYVDDPLLESGD